MPLSLSIIQPGAYTIEDDGVLGNNTSVIRNASGQVVFTLVHPADSLTITTVAGVSLTVNITDSFDAANVTIGDLANPGASPDSIAVRSLSTAGAVVLVATGAITEAGSDAAPDITAGSLVLSAGTGVGVGNALEFRAASLEAETNTGGINLSSLGAVTVGGLTDSVDGLDVATSGNIVLTAAGSILLNDVTGPESVHGGTTSGDVTLTALGAEADITSLVDRDAINAPHGSITLNAGRDIRFGTAGANFDNDVRARGSLTMTAGRDITVDGFADMASDDFGGATGGNLTATAQRNITVANATGNDAGFSAGGPADADVILTTGPGGLLSVLAGNALAITSTSGDILVRADLMVIGATSGLQANGGMVSLRTATSGRAIDLGLGGDPTDRLALSDAELDRVVTGQLNIGDPTSDTVTVSAAISRASGGLTINSGANLMINASLGTTGAVVLNAADHTLIGVAGAVSGSSVLVAIDAPNDDPGSGGIYNLNGTITGPTSAFGNADNDTMIGNSAANVFNGAGGADLLRGLAGADILRGGDGADTLEGGAGADRLEGGAGSDQMSGGADNDTYVVNDAGDVVTELVGEGVDTIETNRPSLTLSANVENLTYTGAAAFVGVGNALGNTIRGGTAGDSLLGGDGNDIILGGAGAANQLQGGLGDDYFILQVADTVIEQAGQGTDTIEARLNAYVLGANIENLIFGGVGNFNGTGNAQNNLIIGGAGNDTLRGGGGGGTDQLRGGAGSDTVQLAGLQGQYSVTPEGLGFRIIDSVAGRDGSILVTDIETIRYSNGVTEPLPPSAPALTGGKTAASDPQVLPGVIGEEDGFLLKSAPDTPLVLPPVEIGTPLPRLIDPAAPPLLETYGGWTVPEMLRPDLGPELTARDGERPDWLF